MKKLLYYSVVMIILSVLFVGCDSVPDLPIANPDTDSPTIDPPVNELLRKDFDQKVFDKKLDAYGLKYVRKAQEQTTLYTTALDTIQ